MRTIETAGQLHIGTSGWSYQGWRDVFYPAGLPSRKWLGYYSTTFRTVEVNNTFYRLPARKTFEAWRDATPAGFTFAVKASRYITHVKKLKDAADAWEKFVERAGGLGSKLGPILFQFPENWHADVGRLAQFLGLLDPAHRYAFEFRHASWLTDEVFELLAAHGAALVLADSPRWPLAEEITAPFTFIRMHGGRVLYASEYSLGELEAWAKKIADFLHRRLEVFVYFNNDAYGYAVKNALQLRELLEQPLLRGALLGR